MRYLDRAAYRSGQTRSSHHVPSTIVAPHPAYPSSSISEGGVNWARNPWLGAVVALAALGIYARAATPLAALAIGLPFALVTWAYWCFLPRMAASPGAVTAPSSRLFPKVLVILILSLMVAWFVYMCYGLVTERGVIGWLNAVQAARDGTFSTKLSFIVALCYLLCATGAIGLAGVWLGRGRAPAPSGRAAAAPGPVRSAARPDAAPPPDQTRLALWMLASVAVGAWIIGYPVSLWIAAEHREDAQARYAQVALGATPLAWPQAPHVALDGAVQGDNVLVLKEGNHSRKTYFVPMTGRAWTPDQPVSAVLTFDAEYPPQLDRPVLGRLRSDTLPKAVIDAFARSGVKIDPAHRLVDLVPSQHGQVLDRSDDDRQSFLMIATGLSVTSLLGGLMVWSIMKFKRRPARPA